MPFWETNLFSKQAAIIPKQQSISDLQDECTLLMEFSEQEIIGPMARLRVWKYSFTSVHEKRNQVEKLNTEAIITWCLYCYLWTYLTSCSTVFIVNFEKVNAACDSAKNFHGNATVYSKNFKFLFC